MLNEVRQFMEQRRRATLAEVALHLDCSPEVARAALERWQRKGMLHSLGSGGACSGGCQQCDSTATEVYQWGEQNDPGRHYCGIPTFK